LKERATLFDEEAFFLEKRGGLLEIKRPLVERVRRCEEERTLEMGGEVFVGGAL
jgi:hypothetical protein